MMKLTLEKKLKKLKEKITVNNIKKAIWLAIVIF